MNSDDLKPTLEFQGLLREELEFRRSRNKAYSARAFARDLEISPGYLVGLLSGSKILAEEKAIRLAQAMKWGQRKTRFFATLVRYRRAKDESVKFEILKELDQFRATASAEVRLSLDKFRVVADWYHFAIAELLDLDRAVTSPAWIAKRLKIPLETVRIALGRLESVQLVKRVGDRLTKTHTNYLIEDVPSQAVREHHRQVLERAKLALSQQPLDVREFTSTSLAINTDLVPTIKERIRSLRREIEELAARSENKNAVYELSMQFFQLG